MPFGDIFVLALVVFCVAVVASLEFRSRRRMHTVASGDSTDLPVETASYPSTADVTASRRRKDVSRRKH